MNYKEKQNIILFCKTKDTKYLKKIENDVTKKILIYYSYTCLTQKRGNQELSKLILEYFNDIIQVKTDSQKYIVYTGSYNLSTYESLRRIGVAIVPVITSKELVDIRDEFIKTLRQFPEYLRNPQNPDQDISGNTLVYVLGGFSALGNPSSFHNPLVRKLRIKCREVILPLFKQVIDNIIGSDTVKFEMLIDRMMYRHKSQKVTPESWHRDVIPSSKIESNDEVYGGWLNLDDSDQYFSFIPGSHLGIKLKELESGFATVPEKDIKTINKYRHKISIPPGHMIIFPQYILHEVVGTQAKNNMMRLFLGWRTTNSNNFIHSDMLERLNNQSIIPLPSGQLPPMYAANHASFYLHKTFKPIPEKEHKVSLITWSRDSMQKQTLVKISGKNGDYKIVKRYLDSLKHYGFSMYQKYTQHEIALYKPTVL